MKYATMGLLLSLVVVLVVSGCVSNTGQTTGKQNTEPSHTQATIPETKQTIGTLDDAEKVALQFEVAMAQRDYGKVYDLLIPEIQNLYTESDFVGILREKWAGIDLVFDKIVPGETNEAFAYFNAKAGILERRVGPITMVFRDGQWKLDTFAGYVIDIQQKKDNAKKMEGYKFFYTIGQTARSEYEEIRVNNVWTESSLVDKYGKADDPRDGYTFLLINATVKNLRENPTPILTRTNYFERYQN